MHWYAKEYQLNHFFDWKLLTQIFCESTFFRKTFNRKIRKHLAFKNIHQDLLTVDSKLDIKDWRDVARDEILAFLTKSVWPGVNLKSFLESVLNYPNSVTLVCF